MDAEPPFPSVDSPDRLFRDLRSAFREWSQSDAAGRESSWTEGRFNHFALRTFRLQYRHNRPYRRFCRARDVDPPGVTSWTEIPAVPTAGLRSVPLIVGSPEEAVLEFRTSGTTGRLDRRGRHLVRDPSLYRASLESTFRILVLEGGGGDGPARTTAPDMLSLIPPFSEAPHSSLAWMVDAVMERFGGDRVVHAATGDGIEWGRAAEAVERACGTGRPLCVLATTLAAAEWMERLTEKGVSRELPAGSLLMDTGGTKGRSGLEREAVLLQIRDRLGLGPDRVVNEYGMTELLSQRYSRRGKAETDWLVGPPWLRTRALDPESLEPLPDGEEGVLCHFDLGNAGSVCAVLTEDLGRVRDGRLCYSGRAEGSPPRGCSLATAELLEAQERGPDAARRVDSPTEGTR